MMKSKVIQQLLRGLIALLGAGLGVAVTLGATQVQRLVNPGATMPLGLLVLAYIGTAVVFGAIALHLNLGREKPMAIVLEGSTYQKSTCLQALLKQELEELRKTYGVGFAIIAAENTTLTGSAYAAVSNT